MSALKRSGTGAAEASASHQRPLMAIQTAAAELFNGPKSEERDAWESSWVPRRYRFAKYKIHV